jgi:hypothetical protein
MKKKKKKWTQTVVEEKWWMRCYCWCCCYLWTKRTHSGWCQSMWRDLWISKQSLLDFRKRRRKRKKRD